ADLVQRLQEDLRASAALHRLEHLSRGVLQGNIEILADVVVLRDGLEQAACDAIGIGVEEAQPAHAFDARKGVEQLRESVLDAEIFAIAGCVLASRTDSDRKSTG